MNRYVSIGCGIFLLFLTIIPAYGQHTSSANAKNTELLAEANVQLENKNHDAFHSTIEKVVNNYAASSKWDSIIYMCRKASEIALDNNDMGPYGQYLMTIAEVRYMTGKSEESFMILESLNQVEGLPDREKLRLHYKLGDYNITRGDPAKAEILLQSALELSLKTEEDTYLGNIYTELGELASSSGSKIQAINHYLDAVPYLEKLERNSLLALNYINISNLFDQIGDYENSQFYLDKAEVISDNHNLVTRKSNVIYRRGQDAMVEGSYDIAKGYFLYTYNNYKERNEYQNLIWSIVYLARIHAYQADYPQAKRYLDEAAELLKGNGLKEHRSFYYSALTDYYIRTRNYSSAQSIIGLNKTLAGEVGKNINTNSFLISEINYYKAIGNTSRALTLTEAYHKLQDSIKALYQNAIVLDLEAKYNKAEQEKEINTLNLANEITAQKLHTRNLWLIAGGIGLAILMCLVGGLWVLYQKVQMGKTELREKNKIISKALEEKNVLLKEIHHRVKNNLQVISSLLGLQSRYVKDETALEAINDSKSRVHSMSILHQNLYQEDNLTGVDMKDYFRNLVENIFDTYQIGDEDISFSSDIDDLNLDIDTVVPIGLMANELITNALKHAFSDGNKGNIHLALKEKDGHVILKVKDSGKGLSQNSLPLQKGSLGTKLIHSFVDKLKAKIVVDNTAGTDISIYISKYKKAG